MMKKMKKIDVLNDQVTRFAHDNKQTCSDNFVYIRPMGGKSMSGQLKSDVEVFRQLQWHHSLKT